MKAANNLPLAEKIKEGRKYYANKKMPDYVQNRDGEFHDAENQGGQAD